MPSIIACPSCAGQLRLPEELLGQEVRCPTCRNVFTAALAPAAPLDLSLDNGPHNGQEPKPGSAKPRGLAGAVEVQLSLDDDATALPAPSRMPEPPLPKPPSQQDREPRRERDWDRDSDRFRKRESERRDREPHRGVLVLVLGIISLCVPVIFWPLSPVGLILGLVAWVMGHGDLKKMNANQMDPDGSGLTKAGWICGIIGTLLNTLAIFGCFGFISFILLSNANRPQPSYKTPVQFNATPPTVKKVGPPAPQKNEPQAKDKL